MDDDEKVIAKIRDRSPDTALRAQLVESARKFEKDKSMSPSRSYFGRSAVASTQFGTTHQKSAYPRDIEGSPVRQPDYGDQGRQSLFDSRGFEASPNVTGYIRHNLLSVQKQPEQENRQRYSPLRVQQAKVQSSFTAKKTARFQEEEGDRDTEYAMYL